MKTDFLSHYETLIKAPVEKVWRALTNPELVAQYFFGSNLICSWEVGTPIYFRGEWEGKPYEDKGTVLSYSNNDTLSFSYLSNWSGLPDSPENYLHIVYKVSATPEGTLLQITQSNYDADKATHSESNWAAVIEGMKKLVETS